MRRKESYGEDITLKIMARLLMEEGDGGIKHVSGDVLYYMVDILMTFCHRILAGAGRWALQANRSQINIFDILQTFYSLPSPLKQLLDPRELRQFMEVRKGRVRLFRNNNVSSFIPTGRNQIKTLSRLIEEDSVNAANEGGVISDIGSNSLAMEKASRPHYLTDIYPPLPRPYTYKRTETRGVRETDKVLIAKAKAEQQRQVESNLYRLLAKTNSLPEFINYNPDED